MAKKKAERNWGGRREGAGRKPEAGEPRARYLHHRVLEDEWERWKAAADAAGLPLSAWVRQALDAAVPKRRPRSKAAKPE